MPRRIYVPPGFRVDYNVVTNKTMIVHIDGEGDIFTKDIEYFVYQAMLDIPEYAACLFENIRLEAEE